MTAAQPKVIFLKDYTPPAFLIESTDLSFSLNEGLTTVSCKILCLQNPEAESSENLVLHGEDLDLQAVILDGAELSPSDYQVDEKSLTIFNVPSQFLLETVVTIKPHENKALEGLYQSRTMYCTQCEAEGFRKICYYLDRPDVLSKFTTRVEADKGQFPVLLSNGNLISTGDLKEGRHFAVWQDPHPKPAYLFALVAGKLSTVKDSYTTCSGRKVDIELYVEPKDLDKCDHAVDSLKRAMRWDEEVYGREYDLSIYMIVAVDDFNMGAMENKGLNIFNTSCVLAHPKTTTDAGFQRVEAVVAHEYFHNWSGNRVTCRDWFQLSLKEGFTVFRDAEFSSDMNSRSVKRVEDVAFLTSIQFAEDSGPMAHPVQPASFIEISNFYTVTIYEKGAEVVRMINQLLGPEMFRQGSDLYFDRHDGQAVTCDDFVQAMADVSGRDFTQFKQWYAQAGTPQVHVSYDIDEAAQTLTLSLKQLRLPSPNQEEKVPFFIPVKVALLGETGLLPLTIAGKSLGEETVLELTEDEQQFVFENVPNGAVPSLLRGFSAPVKLFCDYTDSELQMIALYDTDGYNRWDAIQRLASKNLLAMAAGEQTVPERALIDVFKTIINDLEEDPALVGHMIKLPSISYLSEQQEQIQPEALYKARAKAKSSIANTLSSTLLNAYDRNEVLESYEPTGEQIGMRSLRNACLSYLVELENEEVAQLAQTQFTLAGNMTNQLAAFTAIVHSETNAMLGLKESAINQFYRQWKHEALVVNQWLQVQAMASSENALVQINTLMEHQCFDFNNPNKLRSVVSAFANNNVAFHAENGEGYQWLADIILKLNKSNPQIASRLLTPLTGWKKYAEPYQTQMKAALQRISEDSDLSKDVFEVVTKSLQS